MNRKQFCKEFSRRHNMAVTGGTSICIDVLNLLSEVISSEHRVQIDGLGIFKKVRVPSETPDEPTVEQIIFEPSKNMQSKRTMPAPVAAAPVAVAAPSALEQAIIDRIGADGLKKVIERITKPAEPDPIPVTAEVAKPQRRRSITKTCVCCGSTYAAWNSRQKYCSSCRDEARKEDNRSRQKRIRQEKAALSDKPSKVNVISAPNSTINL